MSKAFSQFATKPQTRRPRIGFVGLGWIGRNRLESIAAMDLVDVVAISDCEPEALAVSSKIAPRAEVLTQFDGLLAADCDGVVLATPNAHHAEQSIAALERGLAVFCQKPLARDLAETQHVIAAAKARDKLLGVDLSYRFVPGMQKLANVIRNGDLGTIFAVDLVFHNAYGPGKPWFYDREVSGGGCVLDLGIHLLDLTAWALDASKLEVVSAALFKSGAPLQTISDGVEDYASATLRIDDRVLVTLACSWSLNLGAEARIEAVFHGTDASGVFRNVAGSFYDFAAERCTGTSCETLTTADDANWIWGGLAAREWCCKLLSGNRYDPAVEQLLISASAIDQIYGR